MRNRRRPAGRVRAFRIIAGTLSVLLFSAALPAILVASITDVGRSPAWILTLLVMVWAGFRISLLWVAGVPRLFDFFFWLFCYIFLGLAPTVQIRSDLISTTTDDMDPSLDVPAALVVWTGLLCYELGRLLWIARQHRRQHRPRRPGRNPADSAITAIGSGRTVLLMLGGLAASAYFVSKVGVGTALGSREAAFAARNAAWPDPAMRSIFYAGATYPLLVAAGACASLRRSASTPVVRRTCLLLMIGCSTVLLLIVNPVASARYTFGTVAFALAIYLGAATTARRARLTMLSAVVGFLFLFPLADAFRRSSGVHLVRDGFFGEYTGNPDYDAFWQVANAWSYWQDGLVVWLHQAMGSLLFWVPRSIWPGKPVDTGILLAHYRGYSFDNLSAPLWAELLVNGGLAAVIIGFVLVGMLLRSLDSRLQPSFVHGGLWGIVGAIFPVYMTILLRGSLLQATGSMAVALACIVFLYRRTDPNAGLGSVLVQSLEARSDGVHAQVGDDRGPAASSHLAGSGSVGQQSPHR